MLAGRAAIVGGAAFPAAGVTDLIHSQHNSGNRVIGAGHLVLFFAVALISIAPSLIALARRARSGTAQKAGAVAAAGALLLGRELEPALTA